VGYSESQVCSSEQQGWRSRSLEFRKYLESREGMIWLPTDTRRVLEEVDALLKRLMQAASTNQT
jgi:hypothetical protein